MAFTISYTIKLLDQFSDTSKKVVASAAKMDSTIVKHGRSVKKAAKEYKTFSNAAIASTSGVTTSIGKANQAIKTTQRTIKGLKSDMGRTTQSIQEAIGKVDTLKSDMVKTNQALKTTLSTTNTVKADMAKTNKAIKKTQDRVKSLKSDMDRLGDIGKRTEMFGRSLTTKVTLPIVGAGVASLKMSRDFNKAMASVGTMIPGQSERLNRLKGEVLDLGVETGKSANVISEGLYETISAFGQAEPPMAKLRISTRMAVAGNATVVDSLKLVSAVTKGYGDISDEAAQQVSDMSFKVVELGQTTFPELAASMGRVVPIAAAMGIEQKELFTSYATLTGVTGNAARVSTQMTAILGAMIKPSKNLIKVVKKLGYSSASTMIKELGLHKSLMMISDSVDGNADKISDLVVREEALAGMLALTGAQSSVYTKKLKQMASAVGATDDAYREQTEGINKAGFAFERMKQRAFKMAVVIGDKLMPQAERSMDWLEPFIDKASNASDEQINLALKIAGVAAAIGPLLTVMGHGTTLISMLGSAVGGSGGLAGMLALATGPVGIAAGAIAGLGFLTAYCWDEMENLRDGIKDGISPVINDLTEDTDELSGGFRGIGKYLKISVGFVTSATAPFVKLGLKMSSLPFRGMIKAARIGIQVFKVIPSAIDIASNSLSIAYNWVTRMAIQWLNSSKYGRMFLQLIDHLWNSFDNLTGYVKTLWDYVEGLFSSVSKWLDKVGIGLGAAADEQARLQDAAVADMRIEASKGALSTNVNFAPATGVLETSGRIQTDITIKAPEGVVKDVKTRTKNAYANVNTGKNDE